MSSTQPAAGPRLAHQWRTVQVVPLQSVDSRAWARRGAQRYLSRNRTPQQLALDPLHTAVLENPLDARAWAQVCPQWPLCTGQAQQLCRYAAALQNSTPQQLALESLHTTVLNSPLDAR